MAGHDLKRRYSRQFFGLRKFSSVVAWSLVGSYVAQVLIGIAVGHLLLSMPLQLPSVALAAFLTLFIGTRLRGLNNIVHECSHSTFAERRRDNVIIGKVCSALLTGCFTTYKEDHLSHHAHLGNYERDNELRQIEKFRLHDRLTFRTILRLAIVPLLGRHLPVYSRADFSGRDGAPYLALKFGTLGVVSMFAFFAPGTAAIFVIFPLFYVFPTLNFWTDCLDHAGLVGAEDELSASRNFPVPALVRLMFFPRNDCYHLVHHLFPMIPARHLPSAHKELSMDSDYNSQDNAVRRALRGRAALLRHFKGKDAISGEERRRKRGVLT